MQSPSGNLRSVSICLLAIFIFALAGTACSPGTPAAPAAPAIDATGQAAAMKQTENAMRASFNQTATAEKQVFVEQLTQSAMGTQTAMVTPTATITPTATQLPSATPNLLATRQYQGMADKVQQYVKDGFLPSADGTYTRLNDHQASVAKIGFWESQSTGFSPVNFAIESDVAWDSASETSNWFAAGCGYVFHHTSDSDEYMVFLSLDGWVVSAATNQGKGQFMGDAYYDKLQIPAGKAHIALVVNGNQYAFFVNGKLVKKYTGYAGGLLNGELHYAQVSGTNVGFGTSCEYTNTDLWTVKD